MKTIALTLSLLVATVVATWAAPPPPDPAAPEGPTLETAGTAATAAGTAETAGTGETAGTAEGEQQDRVSMGQDMTIKEGEVVYGDAVVVGGDLVVNGTVKGDAVTTGGDLTLGPAAVVEGDAVATGGKLTVSPTAKVGGEKVAVNVPGLRSVRLLGDFGEKYGDISERVVKVVKDIVFFGLLMLIGLLLTVFLPRQMGNVGEHLTGDFPRSALLGVGIMVLLPIALLALTVSIIGIPVVPLLLLAAVVAALAGYVCFGQILGRRLVGDRHPMFQIFIGLLLFQGASILGDLLALPGGLMEDIGGVFRTIGVIIALGASFLGFGAVVYSVFGRRTLAETVAAREKKKEAAKLRAAGGAPPATPPAA